MVRSADPTRWLSRRKRALSVLGFSASLALCLLTYLRIRSAPSNDCSCSCSCEPYNRTFFFVETSGSSRLNARQACAVESAALHHPNLTVKLFTKGQPDMDSSYINTVRNIPNIRVSHVDPEDVFGGTPLESWYRSSARLRSPYAVAHLSDAMRLALLWCFGGVYLDTDVVVKRSMLDLRNALGTQNGRDLANGVLIFEKCHPVLLDAMTKFTSSYGPWHWTSSGSDLLHDVINERCPDCLSPIDAETCGCDLHVLSPNAFYAVRYEDWKDMFDPSKTADALLKTNESYLLHFWNYLSGNAPVGRGSLYDVAARMNCPTVYQVAERVGYF